MLLSILSSCEVITDVGLDKFVLITSGNSRAQAVAVARQIAIARGAFLAGAIAIGAPFLARAYGAGEHYDVIAWIGLVPLIQSFRNWRVIQIQQEYKYGVETISSLGGQICAVTAIFPAIVWFHDERAMLVSLIVEATAYVVLSNLLVQREPVIAIDAAIRRNALRFGLPLMANGLALVAIKQMDQVIVANLFDFSTLALYSLALNLAVAPTSVMQRIAWKICIPFLAKSHASPGASREASVIVVLGMVIVAAAYAIFLGVFLDSLIPFVYGPGYHATLSFCTLVTLAAFLRFCRGGPNFIFASIGETGRLTIGNMVAL
ncbi:MAG TPA: oligosaccharide flippase family protein, partial [Burkholderiaceae bacterium]|nr:oligosaccharide flippase family protein [Burkholderiaceae bacterium]